MTLGLFIYVCMQCAHDVGVKMKGRDYLFGVWFLGLVLFGPTEVFR